MNEKLHIAKIMLHNIEEMITDVINAEADMDLSPLELIQESIKAIQEGEREILEGIDEEMIYATKPVKKGNTLH